MDKIKAVKVNETYIRLQCEKGIKYELRDYFTFAIPGAQFMPTVRSGAWDGKIRLFSIQTSLIYLGLIDYIKKFCEARGYELEIDSEMYDEEISVAEAKKFCAHILKDWEHQIREHQLVAFTHAMRKRRCILLSPTASGKSLIIYLIARAMLYKKKKVVIIVPSTTLVYQLQKDFADYKYTGDCRVITGGEDKEWKTNIDQQITITTWQSIYKMPKQWFSQFGAVVGDECHLFKSKSLTTIMEKLDGCAYRFGTTGTLDDTLTNKLVLTGLFGGVKKVTTSEQLMKDGHIAQLDIKCIVLGHTEDTRKRINDLDYQGEKELLVMMESRNRFIVNLAKSVKGNTLILYQFVEKHGKVLYNNLLEASDKEIYFISGKIKPKDREVIKQLIEAGKDVILVASYGCFSTGENVVNIENVIFGSPYKSRIKVLQSVGRGLRKGGGKTHMNLYDIADDAAYTTRTGRVKKNQTLDHFGERIKYYNSEKFNYKIYQVKLND